MIECSKNPDELKLYIKAHRTAVGQPLQVIQKIEKPPLLHHRLLSGQ